nr:MAG TPA: hypothetical protein [Caudoviricetes sp.]
MDELAFNALRKEVREYRTEADDRLSIIEARLDRIEQALAGGAQVTVAAPVEPAVVMEPVQQTVADYGGATDPADLAGEEPAVAPAPAEPAPELPAADDALATADPLKAEEPAAQEPAKPEDVPVLPLKGSKAKG